MPQTLTLIDTDAAEPRAAELVGRSPAIDRVRKLLRNASALDTGVLLVGEAGIDAESIARDLHRRTRAGAPFVTVECGAADTAWLESALFGPTPEQTSRDLECVSTTSRLAAARGGTLFLQDLTELPSALQARLGRAVRDGEVRLDGDAVGLDIRTIACAHPRIDAEVRDHHLRPDLYRRLSVTRIDLPPLRERREDLPALAARVLLDVCARHAAIARRFTQPALALFGALDWSGNLAELKAVIERVVAATPDPVIQIEHIVPALQLAGSDAPFTPAGTLREARVRFERDYIAAVLRHHGWHMANAAQTLGIQRPNLYRKIRQLGLPTMRLTD